MNICDRCGIEGLGKPLPDGWSHLSIDPNPVNGELPAWDVDLCDVCLTDIIRAYKVSPLKIVASSTQWPVAGPDEDVERVRRLPRQLLP